MPTQAQDRPSATPPDDSRPLDLERQIEKDASLGEADLISIEDPGGVASTLGGTSLVDIENANGTVLLRLDTHGGFVVTGVQNTGGVIPATGPGGRMMWFPNKVAFRAGRANGAEWDNASIGYFSSALGYHTTASGTASAAMGARAKALHDGTFVWADNTGLADFASTAANQFLIRAANGVGIGTTSPEGRLHVAGSEWRTSVFESTGVTERGYLGVDNVAFALSTNTYWGGSSWAVDDSERSALALLLHRSNNRFEFRVRPPGGSQSTAMIINDSRDVGIGTTNPTERLHVVGNVRASDFVTTSDARFKTAVAPIIGAREAILALRGVRYEWDRAAHPEADLPEGEQLGFIAQEVRGVLPELVREGSDGTLSVAYSQLVPVLVETVREQQEEINALTERLERLERMMEMMASRD